MSFDILVFYRKIHFKKKIAKHQVTKGKKKSPVTRSITFRGPLMRLEEVVERGRNGMQIGFD